MQHGTGLPITYHPPKKSPSQTCSGTNRDPPALALICSARQEPGSMGGWMGSCRMPVPISSSWTPVMCGCRSRDGIWQLASVLVPHIWWDELGSAQPPDPFQNPPAGPMPPPPAVLAQARMRKIPSAGAADPPPRRGGR